MKDLNPDHSPETWYPVAPPAPRKGRGAVTNLQGRYEVDQREAFDDGWQHAQPGEGAGGHDGDGEGECDSADDLATEATPALRTQVFEERAKSILTRNQSPDIPFNVSLNPYRGCEHVIGNENLFRASSSLAGVSLDYSLGLNKRMPRVRKKIVRQS